MLKTRIRDYGADGMNALIRQYLPHETDELLDTEVASLVQYDDGTYGWETNTGRSFSSDLGFYANQEEAEKALASWANQ